MTDLLGNSSLADIKRDITFGLIECSRRGLSHSVKWLAEIKHGLIIPAAVDLQQSAATGSTTSDANVEPLPIDESERNDYDLAKSYFDLREYDRAAYFVRNSESMVPKFLHLYASFMAKEKRRLDNLTDTVNLTESGQLKDLADLLATLKSDYAQRKLDGFCLYLYGVVLKKLDLKDMAIPVLVESVHATPTLWSSWLELSPLITHKDQLMSLNLPNHWMKSFFLAHTQIELFLNDEGLDMFEQLQEAGFKTCTYITAEIAIAYHNKRSEFWNEWRPFDNLANIEINFSSSSSFFSLNFADVEKAIEIFQHLQEIDPYRLDNLDTLSNLLFVKEMKKEMASLAHRAVEINKYRPETCCVIGEYRRSFPPSSGGRVSFR